MPLPHAAKAAMVDGERIDIVAFWRYACWPVVHDAAAQIWVLDTDAAQRADAMATFDAPDFELPDLDGRMHRLSDYRGRRVFMAAWASWCGCRLDLPAWWSLCKSLDEKTNFTVLAIALDQPETARPWIESATPTFPCLIDRDHRTAELHHLTNVPQAVWINERGRIVRPPENAGSTDGCRAMNRATPEMSARRARRAQAGQTALRRRGQGLGREGRAEPLRAERGRRQRAAARARRRRRHSPRPLSPGAGFASRRQGRGSAGAIRPGVTVAPGLLGDVARRRRTEPEWPRRRSRLLGARRRSRQQAVSPTACDRVPSRWRRLKPPDPTHLRDMRDRAMPMQHD